LQSSHQRGPDRCRRYWPKTPDIHRPRSAERAISRFKRRPRAKEGTLRHRTSHGPASPAVCASNGCIGDGIAHSTRRPQTGPLRLLNHGNSPLITPAIGSDLAHSGHQSRPVVCASSNALHQVDSVPRSMLSAPQARFRRKPRQARRHQSARLTQPRR